MSVFKTLLKPQKNPLYFSLKSLPISSCFYSSTTSTTTPSSPQENKKPIDVIFKEAVGLCKKAEGNCEGENTNELKSRLRELEREVIELRANSNVKRKELKKSKSLYAVFTNQPGYGERTREQVPEVYNELSPDMELFVNHLYKEGYFNNANFLRGNKLEFGCFQSRYGRDFIKFAAEKFSLDHQEIAKWLSGSDLKKVALFGCPSLTKKNVFAAKRLRKFFEIQENTVCSKCVLKHSCKFVNQSVWKGDTKNLNLAVVMRVIILYALELVRPELGMPNEIQVSVSRLLKEVLKLSQTMS